MTPQDIQEKHFHDAFRGYSHEEVDLFLDEVAVAFERLYRENQSFMRRMVDLEEQVKRAQERGGSISETPAMAAPPSEEETAGTESALKRMLLIAQETADRAVAEARQKAREIADEARARAEEMIEQAERRVRELGVTRTQKERELQQAKEALRKFDQQYRTSFRVFIESQLEALNDLPSAPPASPMTHAPGLSSAMLGAAADAAAYEPMPSAPLPEPGVEEPDTAEVTASPGGEAAEAVGQYAPVQAPQPPAMAAEAPPQGAESDGGRESTEQPPNKESQTGEVESSKPAPSAPQQEDDRVDSEDDRLIRELFWGEE